MRRYSDDEKRQILKEVEDVGNIHTVCKKRGLAPTTVHNWLRKQAREGIRNYPAENRKLKKTSGGIEA